MVRRLDYLYSPYKIFKKKNDSRARFFLKAISPFLEQSRREDSTRSALPVIFPSYQFCLHPYTISRKPTPMSARRSYTPPNPLSCQSIIVGAISGHKQLPYFFFGVRSDTQRYLAVMVEQIYLNSAPRKKYTIATCVFSVRKVPLKEREGGRILFASDVFLIRKGQEI